MVAFRADLRVARAKKFDVPLMSAGNAAVPAFFASTSTTDEKGIWAGRLQSNPYFRGANALLSLLRLISDQAFRHGWSLAGCRLEFLAARIVVRNKEVLNFAY